MHTMSKLAFAKGRCSPRACSTGAAHFDRHSRNIPELGSRPMAVPAGPTSAAAERSTRPVPVATSSTRMPLVRPAFTRQSARYFSPVPIDMNQHTHS